MQAGAIGTYALRAIANDQGYPSPVGPLAQIIVDGEPLPMPLPVTLGTGPLAAIRDEEVTNTRRLTLSVDQPEFPPAANYQEFRFLVCGRTFDPNRVDQRIPLGAVEEWTVVNEHEDDHAFHIHTNPFQMVAINREKLAERDWRSPEQSAADRSCAKTGSERPISPFAVLAKSLWYENVLENQGVRPIGL